jgi:hypothetical protein
VRHRDRATREQKKDPNPQKVVKKPPKRKKKKRDRVAEYERRQCEY